MNALAAVNNAIWAVEQSSPVLNCWCRNTHLCIYIDHETVVYVSITVFTMITSLMAIRRINSVDDFSAILLIQCEMDYLATQDFSILLTGDTFRHLRKTCLFVFDIRISVGV